MIQRVQTIYLFLAAVIMAVVNWLPLVEFSVNNNTIDSVVPFYTYGIHLESEGVITAITTYPIAIISALAAVLSFITIFMYKNRIKQINISLISMFLSLMFYLIFFIYWWYAKDALATDGTTIGLGIVFPAISVILNILAAKAIKADEKLVRSADRIR